MKEKLITAVKYKKPYPELTNPTLPYLENDAYVSDSRLMGVGKVSRNGVELEYQDIRVYIKFKDHT
jgi:hypothetical protein